MTTHHRHLMPGADNITGTGTRRTYAVIKQSQQADAQSDRKMQQTFRLLRARQTDVWWASVRASSLYTSADSWMFMFASLSRLPCECQTAHQTNIYNVCNNILSHGLRHILRPYRSMVNYGIHEHNAQCINERGKQCIEIWIHQADTSDRMACTLHSVYLLYTHTRSRLTQNIWLTHICTQCSVNWVAGWRCSVVRLLKYGGWAWWADICAYMMLLLRR